MITEIEKVITLDEKDIKDAIWQWLHNRHRAEVEGLLAKDINFVDESCRA